MKFLTHFFILISVAVVLAACAPAAQEPAAEETPSTEADVEAIKELREEYNAAVEAGDVARVISLFADEAVLMPPNEPPATGKEATRSWYETLFEQFNVEPFTSSAEEVEVTDDWAFDRGTYSITLTPKAGGEPAEDSGKFIAIFQRQTDGSWKVARGIWNSDNPPPGS